MQNLTHSDISMYKSFLLKGGNSASTVNRKLAALKMYNRFLIDNNKKAPFQLCYIFLLLFYSIMLHFSREICRNDIKNVS